MRLLIKDSNNLDICPACKHIRIVPLDEEEGCSKCGRKWSINGKSLDYLERRSIRINRYLNYCVRTGNWP